MNKKMKPTNLSTQLMGCNEIEIHYKRSLFSEMKSIKSAEDVNQLIRTFIDTKRIDYKEFFWVVLLNRANSILGISEIAMGSSSAVAVDVKEICQLALLTSSLSVIVIHNHPSGTLKPSETDKRITEKIKKTLDLFGISLLDHLIITSENYYSFADKGII
jgi:DNA repair protein RadC